MSRGVVNQKTRRIRYHTLRRLGLSRLESISKRDLTEREYWKLVDQLKGGKSVPRSSTI